MKKILNMIVVFFVTLLLLTGISYADLTATAQLNADSTKVEKGDYVTITFSVNSDGDIQGFEGFLTYDKEFFSDIIVTSNYSINDGYGYAYDGEDDGYIALTHYDPIPSGTLFTVRLQVSKTTTKESGSVGFDDSEDLYVFNANRESVDLDVEPIEIELDDSEPIDKPTNNVNNIINNATKNEAGSVNNVVNNANKGETADKNLPKTGKMLMLPIIGVILVTGTAAFIKYKKTKID